MLLDWVICAVLVAGFSILLKKALFSKGGPSTLVLWLMTVTVFVINLVVMTALKILRYISISQNAGVEVEPSNPLDVFGALIMTVLFYSILRD